jgi:hypothetical protein
MCDDEVGVLVQVKMNFVELRQKMLSKREILFFHEMYRNLTLTLSHQERKYEMI